ncbi:hypothetical protein SDC9_97701 [bioreactor metagenome]|uniref:Uncharacterized protein n=1 Tax=bioreactor metagenome TaxID=1076179 RepID=A0A645ACL8_9ZZZZ
MLPLLGCLGKEHIGKHFQLLALGFGSPEGFLPVHSILGGIEQVVNPLFLERFCRPTKGNASSPCKYSFGVEIVQDPIYNFLCCVTTGIRKENDKLIPTDTADDIAASAG